MNQLISIIIPVYNRETIIRTTIDSIVNQTYTNWECILVDDGSTDNTKRTLDNYIQKDNRFKYIERPKTLLKGANACRNYGFSLAKGKYINWFDSDDIMEPDFLQQKIEAFTEKTDAVLHKNRYSNYYLTRFRDSKFAYSQPENLFAKYALDQIEIQTSGFMWKNKFLENKPLFNENIQRFQDNEFHIRMLALQPEIKIIDKVLATIRGGDGDSTQISSRKNLTQKKLHDIFYYRYQTLKLNQFYKGKEQKEISKTITKKALWSFYDVLRFQKNPLNRFKDVKTNYNLLKIAYLNEEFTLMSKIKSHLYLCYLVLFGNTFYKKK